MTWTVREAETPLPLLPLFVYSPSERTPQWGPTDKGPGSRRFLFCGVTERIGQLEEGRGESGRDRLFREWRRK